jgi:hypothetical protein
LVSQQVQIFALSAITCHSPSLLHGILIQNNALFKPKEHVRILYGKILAPLENGEYSVPLVEQCIIFS